MTDPLDLQGQETERLRREHATRTFFDINRTRTSETEFSEERGDDELLRATAREVVDGVISEAVAVGVVRAEGDVFLTDTRVSHVFDALVDEMEKVEPEGVEEISARIGVPLDQWQIPGEEEEPVTFWGRIKAFFSRVVGRG